MRACLMMLPLAVSASPLAAQTAPAAPAPLPVQPPQQLTDPATIDRLTRAMQAMSEAFLRLPVGEIEAALEGRQPTAADSKRTVRDVGQRDDPNFGRELRRQVAQAKPMIEQSTKALAEALPSLMQGMEQARRSLERAAANMPDPTYPKR